MSNVPPPRVFVASPYAGDVKRNLEYLRKCLRDSIDRGEAPMASHMIYPQVLDDGVDSERTMGMRLGARWLIASDVCALYVDLGESTGMRMEREIALCAGITVVERRILADRHDDESDS